jgi:hypothetical protein
VSETTKSMPRDVEREEKTASQIAKWLLWSGNGTGGTEA